MSWHHHFRQFVQGAQKRVLFVVVTSFPVISGRKRPVLTLRWLLLISRDARRDRNIFRSPVVPVAVIIAFLCVMGVKDGVWPGRSAEKMGKSIILWTVVHTTCLHEYLSGRMPGHLRAEPIFISHLLGFPGYSSEKPVSAELPSPAVISCDYKNAIIMPKRQNQHTCNALILKGIIKQSCTPSSASDNYGKFTNKNTFYSPKIVTCFPSDRGE